MTTTILLARHGETDWNRDGRFQGHADPPLNRRGREQALALAQALEFERIDAVYASDLRRAAATAAAVAERAGLAVIPLRDLREADIGPFTGLTRSEIEKRFPDEARVATESGFSFVAVGEGYEAVASRVLTALHAIAAAHIGGCVLVVTHGGPIRATLAHADGLEVSEHRRRFAPHPNGEVVRLAVRDGKLERVD